MPANEEADIVIRLDLATKTMVINFLFLHVTGADANARDYSGHKPIYYIKSLSMPLKSKLNYSSNVPAWKQHCFAGTKHAFRVSADVVDRLSGKVDPRKHKARKEAGDRNERSEGGYHDNYGVWNDRKNSLENNSKAKKVLRKESMLKGIGMRRKPSYKRSKSNEASENEARDLMPPPPPMSYRPPPVSTGMLWKPVGPKS